MTTIVLNMMYDALTGTNCVMNNVVFDPQIISCDHANGWGEAIVESASRDVRRSRFGDAPEIVECYRISRIHFGHKALLPGVYKLDVREPCGP